MSRLTLRARRALRGLPVAVIQAPKGSILVIEAVDGSDLETLAPIANEIGHWTGLWVIVTVRGDTRLQILRPGDSVPVTFNEATL